MKARLAAVLLLLPSGGAALSPGEGIAVHFKDGSTVTGVLSELTGREVAIEVGGGRVSWPMENVERLETRRTDVQEFQQLLKDAGQDEVKLEAAARFARSRGLYTCYNRLIEAAGLVPEDAQAFPTAPPRQEPQRSPPRQASPLDRRPTLGFGAPGPEVRHAGYPVYEPYAVYIPVPVALPPAVTPERREAFLKDLKERRETFRRRPTSQLEAFQFRLQEAVDRQAHGLPFQAEPL